MIAMLRGRLADKQPDSALLDVNGVGYRVFIPLSTYTELPALDQEVTLHTVTSVREDAFHLFGFLTVDEKRTFNLLHGVSGIGPKLALAALSGLPTQALWQALAQEDVTTLARIPGVGKKTAQRMAMELKDKVGGLGAAPAGGAGLAGAPPVPGTVRAELTSALTNLGYKRPQVEMVLRKVITPELASLEDALRLALKELAP